MASSSAASSSGPHVITFFGEILHNTKVPQVARKVWGLPISSRGSESDRVRFFCLPPDDAIHFIHTPKVFKVVSEGMWKDERSKASDKAPTKINLDPQLVKIINATGATYYVSLSRKSLYMRFNCHGTITPTELPRIIRGKAVEKLVEEIEWASKKTFHFEFEFLIDCVVNSLFNTQNSITTTICTYQDAKDIIMATIPILMGPSNCWVLSNRDYEIILRKFFRSIFFLYSSNKEKREPLIVLVNVYEKALNEILKQIHDKKRYVPIFNDLQDADLRQLMIGIKEILTTTSKIVMIGGISSSSTMGSDIRKQFSIDCSFAYTEIQSALSQENTIGLPALDGGLIPDLLKIKTLIPSTSSVANRTIFICAWILYKKALPKEIVGFIKNLELFYSKLETMSIVGTYLLIKFANNEQVQKSPYKMDLINFFSLLLDEDISFKAPDLDFFYGDLIGVLVKDFEQYLHDDYEWLAFFLKRVKFIDTLASCRPTNRLLTLSINKIKIAINLKKAEVNSLPVEDILSISGYVANNTHWICAKRDEPMNPLIVARSIRFAQGKVFVLLDQPADDTLVEEGKRKTNLTLDAITGEKYIFYRIPYSENAVAERSALGSFRRDSHIIPIVYTTEVKINGTIYFEFFMVKYDINLTDLLSLDTKIPFETRIEIALNIATAIFCLHSRKLVHKDIKPDNVLIKMDKKGDVGDVVLSDIGGTIFTKTYIRPHKQRYIPLEFVEEGKSTAYLDPCDLLPCDIYSFGVLLIDLFYGVDVAIERLRTIRDRNPLLDLILLMTSEESKLRPRIESVIGKIKDLKGVAED